METSGTKVKNLFFYLHKNFLVRSKSRWYFGHTEKVWNTYIFDARFWQFKDSNVLYLLTMFEIGLMRELNTILWRCYLCYATVDISQLFILDAWIHWPVPGKVFTIKTRAIPLFLYSWGAADCALIFHNDVLLNVLLIPSSNDDKKLRGPSDFLAWAVDSLSFFHFP